ncbi:MAG: GntR family transcriptional regulator [Terracidiphilus sp.]|jgi:DNA-binding LacI/PurR family transcriptional regulator
MQRNASLEGASEGPKYKRIYLELREALADGTYSQGGKFPSENDLVTRFGASRPTVRRALAELESEGFIERRMGAGTTVSQQNKHKALVFGLLIPELGMTEIFEPICQGISQAHVGGQHDLLWGPSFIKGASKQVQAEHLCRYYIERKVSGVFFAPMEHLTGREEVNIAIVKALDEAQIPVVLLDRDIVLFPARSKYDLVGIDNHRAGYVLTEYLLLSGSPRVAFLAWPSSAHTVDVRLGGYQEALHAHQGSDAQPLVKWVDPSDVAAVQDFLGRAKPDAIVCANDYTAAQLLTTLNTIGVQVPGQIRVAGIDDVKYARLLQTPLTTIRQPCLEIGATALLAMLDRIAHPAAPSREFLVDFQLIIRKSTEPDAPVWPESETTHRSAGEEAASARVAKTDETPSPALTGLGIVRADKL